jgi:hypothetical protein
MGTNTGASIYFIDPTNKTKKMTLHSCLRTILKDTAISNPFL